MSFYELYQAFSPSPGLGAKAAHENFTGAKGGEALNGLNIASIYQTKIDKNQWGLSHHSPIFDGGG